MTATAPRPEAKPTRRPLLVFVPLAVFAALAALFVIRLYSGDASLLPSALIGREVPAFVLPPVEGFSDKPGFSDADLHLGKVTLINVFASWCVPCHQEHELIMRLSADPALARARGAHIWARLQGRARKHRAAFSPRQAIPSRGSAPTARAEPRSTLASMACRKLLLSKVTARSPTVSSVPSARRAIGMSSCPRLKKRCGDLPRKSARHMD